MDGFLAAAAATLARQQALITTDQALHLGANGELLSSLVRRDVWERVERGLYGPRGVPMTWRRSVMAAVLLGPPGTLASHRAAATLHGVGGFDEPSPEISVPRGKRIRRRGVIVHESTDLDLSGRCTVDGIPTTGRARLAVDLGCVMSPDRYRQTMRELRYGLGLSPELLLRTYLRHARRGRNGTGALRDWLDRYYAIVGAPESGLEQVALDAFIDAGLPTPKVQHWVETPAGRYRLDLAYPDVRHDVEIHGSQHDDDPDVVVSDAIRRAALEACGWEVSEVRQKQFAGDLAAAIQRSSELLADIASSCQAGADGATQFSS